MASTSNMQRSAEPSIDIRAQLAATHNQSFPFSSPNIDDHISIRSGKSGNTMLSRDPFESPAPSIHTEDDRDDTSERDEFHLERYSQDSKKYSGIQKGHVAQNRIDGPSKQTVKAGLHLVTDFADSSRRKDRIVFNEISAKQPKLDRSKARSVVSQKGVKFSISPAENQKTFINLSDLVNASTKTKTAETNPRASHRSTVLFKLQIPEFDARSHSRRNDPQTAMTLITPATPRIVVTSAFEPKLGNIVDEATAGYAKPPVRPTSSIYSMPTAGMARTADTDAPPVPPLPTEISLRTMALMSKNPFRKLGQAQAHNVADDAVEATPSSFHGWSAYESPRTALPDSCDTARPKSQGWWNLALSPMLSRAGTKLSRKGRAGEATPPMPPMPETSVATPNSDPSPETPRRLGLASARGSTWSRWTEWEDERAGVDAETDLQSEMDNEQLHREQQGQSRSGKDARFPDGLANEYYHACAVEQLTNTTYFECINHSCAEHLPKLKSIHDIVPRSRVLETPLAEFSPDMTALNASRENKGKAFAPEVTAHSDITTHTKEPTTKSGQGLVSSLDEEDTSDDEPNIMSPNVRHANTAAVVRAKAFNAPARSPQPLPVYTMTAESSRKPAVDTDLPLHTQHLVESPQIMSPEAQRVLAPLGAMTMSSVQRPTQQPKQTFVDSRTSYPRLPFRPAVAPIQIDDIHGQRQAQEQNENRRIRHEKEDAVAKKVGGLWRGRGCLPKNGCFGRSGSEGRKKRRCVVSIAILLVLVIVTCIVLATQLTRRGDATPIQSQWLNLTGYPPMPTGISTIAQPDLVASQNGCVSPSSMWSCSVPKEDQASIAPNNPDQPNLRFQIRFRNGTVPANLTLPLSKRQNDPFTNDLFVPNPTPPNQADQAFLGNTTDNVTVPFDGEQTPFFITFMSPSPALPPAYNDTSQKLSTRQTSSSNLDNAIPAPALSTDGTAAPATLFPTTPFPISQPVRLYNRGLRDEHYGFYIYYDKSIFLSELSLNNSASTGNNGTLIASDQDGGSTKQVANTRCTWAQTRFIVKMFTNPSFGAALLTGAQPNNASSGSYRSINSSATDFNRPGSFPYPATIVLDRHGGNVNQKLVYCYGMNNGSIIINAKTLVLERRDFGGVLVNAAPALINSNNTNGAFDSKAGGIDGGTGGCGCTWQNWR